MDIALGLGIVLLLMYAAYRFGKVIQAAEDFDALVAMIRVEPADETEQESNHYGV